MRYVIIHKDDAQNYSKLLFVLYNTIQKLPIPSQPQIKKFRSARVELLSRKNFSLLRMRLGHFANIIDAAIIITKVLKESNVIQRPLLSITLLFLRMMNVDYIIKRLHNYFG